MKFRLLLTAASAAFAAALLIGPAAGQGTPKPASPKPAASKSAAPAKSAASPSDGIVAQRGQVILADEAVLASDRPGILKFVEPEEGDAVSSGQKVAAMKDEVAVAALLVAEETAKNDIEVRYAEKAAEVAEAELEKALYANKRTPKTLPEVEVARLRLSAERARLQIEKAALDQEIAKYQRDEKAAELATYQIVCPIDGVVTRVHKHDGEAVQQGDPILHIVRTDTVRVEGLVSVVDSLRIGVGSPVAVRFDTARLATAGVDVARLSDPVRNRVFEGKVGFIDVTANPVTFQVRIWAEVPNEGNMLRAGLPVEMVIEPAPAAPVAGGRE